MILIGNDDPTSLYDYSEFIDSCDFVIRFNFARSFHTGLAGSKTSALVLWADGSKGQQMLNGEKTIPNPVIKNAEEIWFLFSVAYPLIEKFNLQNKIIKELHIDVFNERLNLHPTSGMMIIDHVLEKYEDYKKYIVFFGWNQLIEEQPPMDLRFTHHFPRERNTIQKYVNEGKLERIDNGINIKLL